MIDSEGKQTAKYKQERNGRAKGADSPPLFNQTKRVFLFNYLSETLPIVLPLHANGWPRFVISGPLI